MRVLSAMTQDEPEDFRQEMLRQGVKPLPGAGHSEYRPTQRIKPKAPDPAKQIHRLLAEGAGESHHMDVGGQISWLAPHDILECRKPGIQLRLFKAMRQGQLEVGATLDLHGLTVEEARGAVARFVTESSGRGVRCGLLIHGKGWHSEKAALHADASGHGKSRLKSHINHWLQAMPQVLAFCSALPRDGGTGAVYILLRRTGSDAGE